MSDPGDPTSADAVARSMGLGGDLPARRARWRGGAARAPIVTVALLFSGYVFAWGGVEEESRITAAIAGGITLGVIALVLGALWWALRHLVGRPRPFGRTVFNYGLVGTIVVLGILGADELLG